MPEIHVSTLWNSPSSTSSAYQVVTILVHFFLLLFVASCEVPVSHDDFAADLKVRIDALIPDQISNVNQANRSKAWLHKIVDQVSR